MYNILYIEIRVDLISDDIVFNNLFQDFLNRSWVSCRVIPIQILSINRIMEYNGKNGNFNEYCM